jgi:PAS domain S-box-containing protein
MKTIVKKSFVSEDETVSPFKSAQELLDSSLDVICSFDTNGRFLQCSAAAKRIWGYNPEELLGRKYIEMVHVDDQAKTIAAAEAIVNGQDRTNFENRYIKKDGSFVPIVWSATWDEGEQIMYCVARDATEKRQLEESLSKARRLFEVFMNNSPLVGWITDEEGVMRYMNELFLKSYGLSPDDVGKNIHEIFSEQTAREYRKNNSQVLKEGKAMETFEKSILPDGHEQVLRIFRFPLFIDGVTMVGGWAVNITEQIDLQEQLQLSLERYQHANTATSDAIYEWDVHADQINRGVGFHTLFGLPEKQVSFAHRLSLIHPKDVAAYEATVMQALGDKAVDRWEAEIRFKNVNGVYRIVIDRAFIIRQNSKPVRAIGALQDVTNQRKLQKEIQRQKIKEEVIKSSLQAQEKEREYLARELHDNVNPTLASVKLLIGYMIENKEADVSLLAKCYDTIQQVITDTRRISHEISPSLVEDLEIGEALEQLIQKFSLAGNLEISLQNGSSEIISLKQEMKLTVYRIVQEQLNNILKHAAASHIQIKLTYKDGMLTLVIEDDGKGFDTKKVKKGLGLKNIMMRVKYHNGTFDLASTRGNGCKLAIALPIL